jgi:Peptidase family C25/Propeptide_C25/FlgD Ig-like domain/Peptidase family C25, C terminal ig-like domain
MKSTRVSVLCLVLLAGFTTLANADVRTLSLNPDQSRISLVEQRSDELVYSASVGELATMDVDTDAGKFSRLMIPGFHTSHVEGKPELPMMNRLIEIPFGANARVEIVAVQSRSIDLAELGIDSRIFPAQPSMPKNIDPADWPFIYDLASYNTHRVASDLVAVDDMGTMRGARIGLVKISPVEYFPQENRLEVYEEVDFRVVFDNIDTAGEAELKARTYSPFFSCLYDRLDGARGLHDDHPDRVGDIVTMVVITPSMFEAQLADYIAWKERRGFKVVVGVIGTPEVGSTNTSIQSYIHDLYNNPPAGQAAPSFIAFFGDVAQCPTFTVSGDATDRPYGAVDGDYVPDIYYGRLSATNSTQLQAILDKTLMYDQFTMADPSYLGEVTMVAGYDSGYASLWGNGQINYGTSHYFNAAHGILSHTYLYPVSGSSGPQIIQNVSDGCAYVNYTAHGSQTSWSNPSFTQSNINSLQNSQKYTFAVGNCCLTGSYDYGECFGETWLRAADKGAIGYIGASNNTQWDEDYWWGVGSGTVVVNPTYAATGLGAYDGIFHDHGEAMTQWYVTNYAVVMSGNLAVMEAGGNSTYYWNIYNLSGDPSLSIYMGVPDENPVTHLAAIFPGAETLSLEAAPNSYCGVHFEGELIGAGTVDRYGALDITFTDPPLSPGYLELVVTAQNHEPYIAQIEVLPPSGPYVVVEAYSIDDDMEGDSEGNDNGQAGSGETIEIPLTLENVGVDPAIGVVATITTSDEYCEILDGSETFGVIGAGIIVGSSDDFDLEIHSNCPDGHQIVLDLDIAAEDRHLWEAQIEITVRAPVITISRVVIDDTATGNGNGIADPGESFSYEIFLSNSGTGYAENVSLVLSSGHPQVVVDQNTATATLVGAGGEVALTPAYELTIDASAPNPQEFPLWAQIDADWNYASTLEQILPVGGFWDDMESGVGTWTHYAGGGGFIDQWHLSAQRNHSAGGGYSWKQGSTSTAVYGNLCDGCLETEAIDLAQTTRLRFWHWMDAEVSGANPGYAYDGGRIEIQIDGGAWTVLTPEGGYNYLVRTGGTPGPFPAESAFYSGSFGWSEALVLLEDVSGSTAKFRFRFGSDGGAAEEGWYIDDVLVTGASELSAADDWKPLVLHPVVLNQNAPNPFLSETAISFRLADNQDVNLTVFDANGRVIRTLANGEKPAGIYRIDWDGADGAGNPMPSGVYYYRLQSENGTKTRSMRLLR